MRRREFIATFGGAWLVRAIGARTASAGTSSRRPVVAWLSLYVGYEIRKSFREYFFEGLRDFGYQPGRNLDMQFRHADNNWERLPTVVEELVKAKPDVIVAGATLEAVAARRMTSDVPIVCPALAN